MSAYEEFIAAIEAHTGRQGKRQGKHVRLLCPAHDDHEPSLDVAEGADGRPLVQCRSHGCTYDQICAAIGREPGTYSPNGAAGEEWTPRGPATAIYRYTDEQDRLLYEVLRTAGKEFPCRHRDPTTKSGWRWNMQGVRRVLYRLPEVLGAIEEGETIYLCEGEKDVEAILRTGAVGTCNPGGASQPGQASKWRREYTEQLAGAKRIIIVADNDEAGLHHALDVRAALSEQIADVRIALARTGKDAHDHLAAGHTLEQLVPWDGRPEPERPEGDAAPEPEPKNDLRVVTITEFISVDEPGAEALLGTPGDVVIPQGGDVMVYGNGGAGKTTLMLDLACHLAAGDDWLGIPTGRPLRTLLVENEGPRPLYRDKLRRKHEAWEGSPLGDRIHVLEDPWAPSASFANRGDRIALADAVAAWEIDVVIVGPLSRSGMKGAGLLEEVNAFLTLVAETRHLSGLPLTVILIHHENKGGQVSGAWEGSGDTLLHVTGMGHGRTRLYFQKARWSSAYHAKTLNLLWAAGDSYTIDEAPELDDETLSDQIVAYIGENPGTPWGKVVEATKGVNDTRRREVRDGLFAARLILNVVKEDGREIAIRECPERRTAHLYLATDPTIAHLRLEPAADRPQTEIPLGEKGTNLHLRPAAGYKEPQAVAADSVLPPPAESNPPSAAAPAADADDWQDLIPDDVLEGMAQTETDQEH